MADTLIVTDGVRNISDFLRGSFALALSINYHGDTIGLLEGRPGYSIVGSEIVASQDINSLKSYSPAGATSSVVAICNGNSNSTITYSTGSAWSSISASLLKDAKFSCDEFLNLLFVVGATSTTYATPGVVNSSYVWATSNANLTGMPKAKFIKRYKDQIYCFNLENYKSRLQYSSIPTNNAITWPVTNYILVPDDQGGDEGMGLEENSEKLLMFKQRSIWGWDGYQRNKIANVGTCASKSIATSDTVTFFLNRNAIYTYSGATPKQISKPIKKWIKGIDQANIANAVGWCDDDHYYCFVGTCTVDGTVYNNTCLRFTISDQTWFVYTYGHTFTAASSWVDSTGKERIYVGTSAGKVEKLALDIDKIYADDGSAIFSLFRTGRIYAKNMSGFKQKIDEIKTFCEKPGNLKMKHRGDGGDWSGEVAITQTVQTLSKNAASAYYYELEGCSSTSALTDQPAIFQGFALLPLTIATR